MKKTFTLVMLAMMIAVTWATDRPKVSKTLLEKQRTVRETKPIKEGVSAFGQLTNPGLKSVVAFNETDLGITKYDLQSNASVSNRLTSSLF